MPLTEAKIRALESKSRLFRAYDELGLYLEVPPSGSKLWRFKYRYGRKEKRLALGAYPHVKLAEARRKRDAARLQLGDGIDPSVERKRAKASRHLSTNNTFSALADEYICKRQKEGQAEATSAKARWFLSLLEPTIGTLPMTEIDPQLLLAALKRLESRGIHETAKKTRSFASRVFRYAVATGRVHSDPASLLQGALVAKPPRHYAAILDPAALGRLLNAVDDYDGHPVTKCALLMLPHVFVRPGELRLASWSEFDLKNAVWTIPAARMKMRRQHLVPLSAVVLRRLEQLSSITGPDGYVFPAVHTDRKPMSENTLNAALRRMGFAKDEVCAHGFRSTASTLLNECGEWSADAIERALGHAPRDAVRATYDRGERWQERVRMAEWWSTYLERVKRVAAQIDHQRT